MTDLAEEHVRSTAIGRVLSEAGERATRATRFLVHDPAMGCAVGIVLVFVGLALVGNLLWGQDPLAIDVGSTLQNPSAHHPMGTDGVGRDVFARFNEGARISLTVGFVVVLVGGVVGGLIGLVAGTVGGQTDHLLMRVMDALLAFPPLILAMAVTVGLGVGLRSAAIGIALTSVPYYARLIRAEVVRIRELHFVESAIALGAKRRRVILRHITPHVVPTLLIQAAALFGFATLTLAALGFVGLGAQVPTPEWGSMITDGLEYALTGQWWIGVFPGLGLLLIVTAASIIADRLRDLLDPRGDYVHL
jgi:peptide/nickel transport system permease protein